MKKALVILGSAAAAIVLVLGIVFYATSGAVETADGFLRAAAGGDMESARSHLSERFKASTSDEELSRFLEQSGLLDYRESSWGERSVDTSSGTLTGRVITHSGGSVPVTFTFVREAGDWKIYHIERDTAGLSNTATHEVTIPSRSEAAELVKATTQAFAIAVNAKDLSPIHASAAVEFRQQVPVEQLHANFAPFLDQDIDLTVLQGYEPMFTGDPALSADGVLRLEGYFPTRPSRAYFNYTFVQRDERWQLLGIDVNVTPVEE